MPTRIRPKFPVSLPPPVGKYNVKSSTNTNLVNISATPRTAIAVVSFTGLSTGSKFIVDASAVVTSDAGGETITCEIHVDDVIVDTFPVYLVSSLNTVVTRSFLSNPIVAPGAHSVGLYMTAQSAHVASVGAGKGSIRVMIAS